MSDTRKLFNFDLMMIQSLGGVPSGWEIYKWELINHKTDQEAIMFEGGVGRPLKSGKRKGLTTWRDMDQSTKRVFIFTHAQMKGFRRSWEIETGMCSKCHGNGDEWFGWSAEEGAKYRSCRSCNATGRSA